MWKFYNPVFDYRSEYHDYDTPWAGHVYFAYDLISNLKPNTIVELGTHKGTSLFSFAQSVKDFNLDTEIYAIDSWKGDQHSGFYGDEVYDHVVSIVRKNYGQQKVRLMKKYFDEALQDFEDNSVDLIHIDSLHTYEAVKHDFTSWLPKLRSNGIILFHDIYVTDFGVWKLWEEIKKEHPNNTYLEFFHNYGLGVMITPDSPITNLFKHKESLNLFYEYYNQKQKTNSYRV